ncbi:ABC transporter-like protein [Thozetella sp. PMI_491]|nr:ABC transporter-like protein [Thozetella sp. PMI_491]
MDREKKPSQDDVRPQQPAHRQKTDDRRPRIGVSFRHVNCTGSGSVSSTRWQPTVGSYLFAIPSFLISLLRSQSPQRVQILYDMEGLIRPGEMLLVLGRPGSGCSTLLKALASSGRGFEISKGSQILYQGLPNQRTNKQFKGERVYLAELDVHFAELTLGQTLEFAASTRNQPDNDQIARATAERFGLTDAYGTRVGNAMIRGISGGEKRRTSIAETFIGGAQFQCWDNSTRGLDSLTALRFVKLLRESTSSKQSTVAMSLYQASQEMYHNFDKVMLLYEGRQIYFGPAHLAVEYFTSLGFEKRSSATTADFLTSLTSPEERIIQEGFKNKVPRLPEEFANVWKQSDLAKELRAEILETESVSCANDDAGRAEQRQLWTSTYPLSWTMEVLICTQRALQRIRNEVGATIGAVIANGILGLVVGSAFYSLPDSTDSLDQRAMLIFFALVVNSFAPAYEITIMWATRPVVHKHHQYAFYHPFAEAVASMVTEFPTKLAMSICLHIPIYFLANLKQTTSSFFIHLLFMFANMMTMSMMFRMIGSLFKSLEKSIPPTSIISLLCIVYTGFVVPPAYMKPWLGWFWRINPVAYTYESLMINEFRDRLFPCAAAIPQGPAYTQVSRNETTCAVIGSIAGQQTVDGSAYIDLKFGYVEEHLWRNLGILFSLMIPFCVLYLLASEYIPPQRSRGEVLLFKGGTSRRMPPKRCEEKGDMTIHVNEEVKVHAANSSSRPIDTSIATNTRPGANFFWRSVNYKIKDRAILTDIDGWVKPGTLTALMGVTGAGKTALLDTLANRVTVGVVSGNVYVDGRPRDANFQRHMGYVQQEDIHLHTATVREALQFSALLRQPTTTAKKEKMAYVEHILEVMDMMPLADAIVGVPGEGLNVEQRKRLTIAVEMVAKPNLLLFLDEPTSGLDSQTAWSVCSLLRKLTDNGQSILCTIHQPSAQLFGMFDRLLLLDKGGTTLYFGDIGKDSSTVVGYFESHGAPRCEPHENPAEWMLQVTGNLPTGSSSHQSSAKEHWSQIWQLSPQKQSVIGEIENLNDSAPQTSDDRSGSVGKREYGPSIMCQIAVVSQRIFTEQWRDPTYTYSRIILCISIGLLNGISFYNTSHDIQGLTNILFSNFLLTQLFSSINQLVIPRFINGRRLFEARERHSQSYHWAVFIISNLIVELAWQTLISVVVFLSWYYPLGLYRSLPSGTAERGAIAFLMVWLLNLWANTLSQLFGVGIEHAELVVQAATLCFWLSLVFCGVLVPPGALPRFWIFMYRVSPLTYLIEGLAASELAGLRIECSGVETLHIQVPQGFPARNCGEYLDDFAQGAGGYVVNPDDVSQCQYCPVTSADTVLSRFGIDTQQPWRDVGILAAYVCFNVIAMFGIYWLARIPKRSSMRGQKGSV